MASNAPLIERVDIHKSCKALESIVNVFNDYCQAAEALALVQKKLARSLKEAVSLKATNELAGNALSAAATLLDSLAEVDAKFVKTVDKECEGVSSDLKKWFKKLAKEERNHDEKISAANAKIKQAGQCQAYEKKAKKKDGDVSEEHTRYVNLLSVVGPEMSQEKYNHSLSVTQRHTAALYNVASSLSRVADAEWTRACDCVRKFSPVIGRIGEYRAYLEGGWMLNIPDGSATAEDNNGGDNRLQDPNGKVDELGVRIAKFGSGSTETDSSVHRSTAPSSYTPSTSFSPSSTAYQSPQGTPLVISPLPSRAGSLPPSSYFPASPNKLNTDSVRSIESLSSFPSPPAHFPLPPMAQLPTPSLGQAITDALATSNRDEERLTSDRPAEVSGPQVFPGQSSSPNAPLRPNEQAIPALGDSDGRPNANAQIQASGPSASPNPSGGDSNKENTVRHSPQHKRRDSIPPMGNEMGAQERKVSGHIERAESVASTNSIVASMRDKWGKGDVSSPTSPRERDIPRVPNKVSDLASRYIPSTDPNAAPLSPRTTGQTLPASRQVSGQNTLNNDTPASTAVRTTQDSASGPTHSGTTASEIDIARRRRRIEELEDLDRREKAQALRAREREIEMQTKELELERARLRVIGVTSSTGPPAATPSHVRGHAQHSYSMVNLVPSRSGGEVPARPVSQHGDPLAISASISGSSSSASNPSSRQDHAPYCGCQTCSASQYSNTQHHVKVVPQPRMQKEKPKGWMRRLSMPVVGNAFSSPDPKKVYGIGAGIAGGGQMGGSLPHFEQDSTGGISNMPVRPRKISFGRR